MFPAFMKLVPTVKCESKKKVQKFFEDIVAAGGEGIMLRNGLAVYTPGRSMHLSKLISQLEAEVKVVKPLGPTKLLCEQANGK